MRCGLLGRKLGHSYSPAIHAALGGYSYELFEREPEEVGAFLRSGGWDGLNVTIPYKRTVIPYLDGLSKEAEETGSVNTIVRRADGTLFGDNTDVYGFSETVRAIGIDVKGRKAIVLGSGGGGAAACYALRALGAEPVIISRSGPDNYNNLDRHADAVLLVNATPVGMYPGNGLSPLDAARFAPTDGAAGRFSKTTGEEAVWDRLRALEGVIDLVYNPARTKLLMDAEKRAIRAENGLTMLVRQAARSSERFTGVPVPEETAERIEAGLRRSMRNIVLVGMPGSGKTSVGKRLAEAAGRPFLDADRTIEERAGKPIARLFAEDGEEAFRRLETEVLGDLGKRSGAVVATGGGCVTRGENYPLLHQNGVIVWLCRDLAELPRDGRPLSLRGSLEAMYEARKPLYERFSDVTIRNDAPIEETVQRILGAVFLSPGDTAPAAASDGRTSAVRERRNP